MAHFRSRETVESALRMSDAGVNDHRNAEIHGVAVQTIRTWRRRYQLEGRTRGGGGYPATPCPRCDGAGLEEEAYALLLGWYLGDGSIARARRGVFTLQIANDQNYPELNQEIATTIKRIKANASPCLRSGPGTTLIEARWKHWPCVFPQHGAGRKHLRKIELHPWQQKIVAKYPELLLRGLFHSDGLPHRQLGQQTRDGHAVLLRALLVLQRVRRHSEDSHGCAGSSRHPLAAAAVECGCGEPEGGGCGA